MTHAQNFRGAALLMRTYELETDRVGAINENLKFLVAVFQVYAKSLLRIPVGGQKIGD